MKESDNMKKLIETICAVILTMLVLVATDKRTLNRLRNFYRTFMMKILAYWNRLFTKLSDMRQRHVR